MTFKLSRYAGPIIGALWLPLHPTRTGNFRGRLTALDLMMQTSTGLYLTYYMHPNRVASGTWRRMVTKRS